MDYIQIDKTSKIPIYNQIASSLEDAILNHLLPNGYHLPTEKEIADFYNVSIGIVKIAYALLEERDLVLRIKGKGSYVKNRVKHYYKLNDLRLNVETHIPFHTALFEKKKTNKLDASYARYFKGSELYHCIRVYQDEHTSIVLEETYVVPDVTKRFESKVRSGQGISKLLYHTDKYNLKDLKNVMFVQLADSKLSKIFAIGIGDPVTRIESMVYDRNGSMVAIIVRYFPSEYIEFESEIRNA